MPWSILSCPGQNLSAARTLCLAEALVLVCIVISPGKVLKNTLVLSLFGAPSDKNTGLIRPDIQKENRKNKLLLLILLLYY